MKNCLLFSNTLCVYLYVCLSFLLSSGLSFTHLSVCPFVFKLSVYLSFCLWVFFQSLSVFDSIYHLFHFPKSKTNEANKNKTGLDLIKFILNTRNTQVVSIGAILTFKVNFTPLEYIPTMPPLSPYVSNIYYKRRHLNVCMYVFYLELLTLQFYK